MATPRRTKGRMPPPAPETPQRPDLAAMIEQDKRERAQHCREAIQAALERFNCTIDIIVTINNAGTQRGIDIVALT